MAQIASDTKTLRFETTAYSAMLRAITAELNLRYEAAKLAKRATRIRTLRTLEAGERVFLERGSA